MPAPGDLGALDEGVQVEVEAELEVEYERAPRAQRDFFSTISGRADGQTPRTRCRSEGCLKTRLTETFPTPPFDSI